MILGVETSCDETAAALVDGEGRTIAQCLRSQVDLHARFGGVVPEIAGRSHVEHLLPVLQQVFEEGDASPSDLEAVAVTYAPGLIGSLLVGVSAAKAVALATGAALVPVHHVEAHVYSCFHERKQPPFPAVALVVSGGHTTLFVVRGPLHYERVGDTMDDAAGEAFDKVAALLELPYPGGPAVEKLARGGDAAAFRFPRSLLGRDSLDFSFSGLKTAVLYHCRGQNAREPRKLTDRERADVAASFQAAVVDVLEEKVDRLCQAVDARAVLVGGGVAANSAVRERMTRFCEHRSLPLYLAERALAGDNAVMVAGLGRLLHHAGVHADLDLDAAPEGSSTLPPRPEAAS